jgi:hypothetical protein
MMNDQPESGNTPRDEVRDAAWNAVAVASVHWQQSVNALRSICSSARTHGLTDAEIALAGGLDESHVVWLLLEDAA